MARSKQRRIEYIAIDVLPPADRNAKGHDDALIGASMDRFGFIEPCLLDERTHQLVAGHGRRERLIAKRDAGEDPPEGIVVHDGMWTVPVVRGWSSADDAEAEAAGLALNQATIAGGWDSETLAAMLADLAQSARGFDGTGFVQANLDDLLYRLGNQKRWEEQTDPDVVPVAPSTPLTRVGDIWLLGDSRVICGDSTKLEDMRRVLADEPIDFVFTSPPYNVGVDYDGIDADELAAADYDLVISAVLANLMVLMPAGRLIGWNYGAMPKARPFVQVQMMMDAGFEFYRQLIWDKAGVTLPMYHNTRDSGLVRSYRPNPRHEFVWLFSKGKPELGGPGDFNEEVWRDDVVRINSSSSTRELWTEPGSTAKVGTSRGTRKQPNSIGRISGGSTGKVHPAPFPNALPQGILGYLCDRDAIVFDPFAGSGTTIIAAQRSGRRGFGVEVRPRYCDVIAERYQRVTEQLPVLERTGKPVDFLARRAKAERARP